MSYSFTNRIFPLLQWSELINWAQTFLGFISLKPKACEDVYPALWTHKPTSHLFNSDRCDKTKFSFSWGTFNKYECNFVRPQFFATTNNFEVLLSVYSV